jgi:NADPH:quinone reductase
MERIVCTAFTDPESLALVEEETPTPGAGRVLVEVAAAGVSFADGLIVRGLYQVKPPLPFTPGTSFSGTVTAVGPEVDASLVGTPVAGSGFSIGTYASHLVVPAAAVVPLPSGVDPLVAASVVESYGTLVYAVTRRVSIAKGEQVVVLGAGGAIGLAAVDVVRSLGARVIAVASSETKQAAATAAGADLAIDYTDLKDGIRAVTDGGADVIIDPVGGPAAEAALRALGAGGRFCVLGFASGEIPRLPANIVLLRNRSIVGVDWGDWAREVASVEENAALLADVLARIGRGELHPARPTAVPLAEAGSVLRGYAERTATGRYVLTP